jgi:PKD repeat protein
MRRTAGFAVMTAILAVLLASCELLFPERVDFTMSTTEGREPLIVAFAPLGTESVTSYIWDFGDGETSAGAEPLHVYRATGTYTVTLTLELADGRISVVQKPNAVTVTPGLPMATGPYIYWVDYGGEVIWRGSRAGGQPAVAIDKVGYPSALAVTATHIYWADGGAIRRARLDGSERQTLTTGQHSVSNLIVDSEFNMIAWVCKPSGAHSYPTYEGSIQVAPLDALTPITVVTYPVDAELCADHIAVDFAHEKLFWTVVRANPATSVGQLCSGSIQMADTSVLVPAPFREKLCLPIDLATDNLPGYGAEYVYWVSREDQEVRRCRIDGIGEEVVIRRAPWFPRLIAVDRLEGKMYITSPDGIERTNLNGTGRQVIFPYIGTPAAIALSR